MNTRRSVRSPARFVRALTAVSLLAIAGCGKILGVHPPASWEVCGNGRDDNADGDIDCFDEKCAGQCTEGEGNAWENPTRGQLTVFDSCNDGLDGDGDGLSDAADPGCWGIAPSNGFECTSGAGLLRSWAGDLDAGELRPFGPNERRDPYVSVAAGTIGGGVGDAPIAGRLIGMELTAIGYVELDEVATLALRPIGANGNADVNVDPRVAIVLDGKRRAVELRFGNFVVGSPYIPFGWNALTLSTTATELVLRVESLEPDPSPAVELRLTIPDVPLPPSALHVGVEGEAELLRSGFDDIRLVIASEHPCGQIVPLSPWSAIGACSDPFVDRGPLRAPASVQKMLVSSATRATPTDAMTCVTASGSVTSRAWALSAGASSRYTDARVSNELVAVAATERAGPPTFVFATLKPTDRTIAFAADASCNVATAVLATSSLDAAIPDDETPVAVSLVVDDSIELAPARTLPPTRCVQAGTLSLYLVTEPLYSTRGAMSRKLYRATVDRETLAVTAAPTALPFPLETSGLPTISGIACGQRVLSYPTTAGGQRAARFHRIDAAALHDSSGTWSQVTILGETGVGQSGERYELVLTSSGPGGFDFGGLDSVSPTLDVIAANDEHRGSEVAWFYGANKNVGLTLTGAPTATLETTSALTACSVDRMNSSGTACFACPGGADASCLDSDVVYSGLIVPNLAEKLPIPRDVAGDGSLIEVVPGSGASWVVPSRSDTFELDIDVEGDAAIDLRAAAPANVGAFATGARISLRMQLDAQRISFETQGSGTTQNRTAPFPREPGWVHVSMKRRRDASNALVLDAVVTSRGTGCELARIEGLPDQGVVVSHVSVDSRSPVPGGGIPTYVEGFELRGVGGAGATTCFGYLVDTTSDPGNCGGCNNFCPPGIACTASSCSCPGGVTQTVCGGGCFNLSTSRTHCGADCAGAQACLFGQNCGLVGPSPGCVFTEGDAQTCDTPNFFFGNSWSSAFNLASAGDDDPTVPRGFDGTSREAVYMWKAPADGYLSVGVEALGCDPDPSMFTTWIDTVLEVYDGGCDGILVMADNDGGACGGGSRATVDVIAGHDYTIVIGTLDPAVATGVLDTLASFVPRGTGNGQCSAPLSVPGGSPSYSFAYDAGTFSPSSTASACGLLATTNAVYIDTSNVVVAAQGTAPNGAHVRYDLNAFSYGHRAVASLLSGSGSCSSMSEFACAQSADIDFFASIPTITTRLGTAPFIALGAVDGNGAPAGNQVFVHYDISAALQPFEDCAGATRVGPAAYLSNLGSTSITPSVSPPHAYDVDGDWSACTSGSGFVPGQDVFLRLTIENGGVLTINAPVSIATRLFGPGATDSNSLDCADLVAVSIPAVCQTGASTSYTLSAAGEYVVAVALPSGATESLNDLRVDFVHTNP